MRSSTINKLAWYIPLRESSEGDSSWDGLKGISADRARQIVHFAECFKNMQFGWDVATALAESNTPFPAILTGDDLYVWRAYRYIKGNEDGVINRAVALTLRANKNTRTQIEALLVADGVDCSFVARKLGLQEEVVKAFEKLFYNVLDRKKDHAFLADLLYPQGRMVEGMDDYLENVDLGTLLKRAGYTQGAKHVLYAAGLDKVNPYAHRNASLGAEELDARFMAEGCLWASLGWINQGRHSRPISNARLSMQASKMGKGQDTGGNGIVDLAADLKGELIRVTAMKMEARSRAQALDIEASVPKNEVEAT